MKEQLIAAPRKSLAVSPQFAEAIADRRVNLLATLGGSQDIRAAYMRGSSASYGWMYGHSPAVRRVVDFIARQIAQLPIKLFERLADDDRQRVRDHPAILTLEHPDGGITPTSRWFFKLVCDFLIYDRAIVLKFRAGPGQPLTLTRLQPYMVAVAGGVFTPELYRIWRRDGTWFDVDPIDIIDWHGYNPDDPLLGFSRLETLRATVTEDQTSQATSLELMKNGLKGGHIERPLEAPEWTPDAQDRFRDSWANQRRLSPRRDPVLEDGMKWVPDIVSPRDAELLAGRRWTVEEVAGCYGVPPEAVGLAGAQRGHIEPARDQVNSDVLPPITTALAEQLDQDILWHEYEIGDDHYYEFDLNEKMRGDPVARFAAITSAVGAPWLTRNEARALENRPAVDEGDELITPLNVIVGDNPRPAPNVMPIQDPNAPPQDGSHRDPGTPPAPPEPEKATLIEVAPGVYAIKASAPMQQLIPRRRSDLERQQRHVDEVMAVMTAHYNRVARVVKRNGNGTKAAAFDQERWDRELGDDLEAVLRSVVEKEGGIYVARLAGDDFDMRLVTNYLRAMSSGAAEAINATTAADIESMGAADALNRAKNNRALVAATSMGVRATIFAREEAAKQSPHYEARTKTWVADTERHAEFDGDTVPVGDDWPAGFAPGSEPNCGCSATIQ